MNKIEWKITKKMLEDTLTKPNKYSDRGLLLEQYEFAGIIEFKDNNCRIVDEEVICDKLYSNHSVKKGQTNSVVSPIGRVNFHTHPLSLYIDNNVIWGWPSGEDMGQSVRFAQMGNLYHLVFSVEGTYAIVVNKMMVNLTPSNISSLETIFKLTHKYRWYENFEEEIDLYTEFKNFIKLCGLQPIGNNTLELWLYFVNNFKLGHF